MIKNLGPFIEASHRYAFIFELLAFWQAIQAWFTSGDSSLLLMERILLTSWGNGSWSVYLICLARFCTSQVVVWDFLTINSMLQKVRSEKEVKNKAPLVPLRKKLGALKITKSFWSVVSLRIMVHCFWVGIIHHETKVTEVPQVEVGSDFVVDSTYLVTGTSQFLTVRLVTCFTWRVLIGNSLVHSGYI